MQKAYFQIKPSSARTGKSRKIPRIINFDLYDSLLMMDSSPEIDVVYSCNNKNSMNHTVVLSRKCRNRRDGDMNASELFHFPILINMFPRKFRGMTP